MIGMGARYPNDSAGRNAHTKLSTRRSPWPGPRGVQFAGPSTCRPPLVTTSPCALMRTSLPNAESIANVPPGHPCVLVLVGGPQGPHPGHERPDAADNHDHHRSGIRPGQRQDWPDLAGHHHRLALSDTEEDGGSTPPAPTTPAMSRAFGTCSSQLWMVSV